MLPCMNAVVYLMLKSWFVYSMPSRKVLLGLQLRACQDLVTLSRSGDHYVETIDCLKSRYDHPCLIDHVHVWKTMEAPS